MKRDSDTFSRHPFSSDYHLSGQWTGKSLLDYWRTGCSYLELLHGGALLGLTPHRHVVLVVARHPSFWIQTLVFEGREVPVVWDLHRHRTASDVLQKYCHKNCPRNLPWTRTNASTNPQNTVLKPTLEQLETPALGNRKLH